MKDLNNISLDLLFRIDFTALVGKNNSEEDSFETAIQKYIDKYQFKTFYSRTHKYVRLSHLQENFTPYLDYCMDLIKNELFNCCQLEQAIGLFENGELKAFLSTDSGLCYNTKGHFNAVEEIIANGQSDILQVNTFYGIVENDKIRLKYSSTSNNIDTDLTDNLEFSLSTRKFKFELDSLKLRAERAINKINLDLNKLVQGDIKQTPIDEVFTMSEIKNGL